MDLIGTFPMENTSPVSRLSCPLQARREGAKTLIDAAAQDFRNWESPSSKVAKFCGGRK